MFISGISYEASIGMAAPVRQQELIREVPNASCRYDKYSLHSTKEYAKPSEDCKNIIFFLAENHYVNKMATESPAMKVVTVNGRTDTQLWTKAAHLVTEKRNLIIEIRESVGETGTRNLIQFLRILGNALDDVNEPHLATALAEAARQATISPEFGGYGLADEYNLQLPELEEKQVIFLLSAYIEAMKCAERAQDAPTPLSYRPTGRRGMTVTEKILAMHDVSRKGWVQPGDVMQVDIDWVLASELSWMVSFVYRSPKLKLTTFRAWCGNMML